MFLELMHAFIMFNSVPFQILSFKQQIQMNDEKSFEYYFYFIIFFAVE